MKRLIITSLSTQIIFIATAVGMALVLTTAASSFAADVSGCGSCLCSSPKVQANIQVPSQTSSKITNPDRAQVNKLVTKATPTMTYPPRSRPDQN